MRDNIIERARELLKSNQIKFSIEENYDPNSVYDMLENTETSFPLLKVPRSAKFLKKRENLEDDSNYLPPIVS